MTFIKGKKLFIYKTTPAHCIQVLHGRQRQFCGIQDLILVLNSSNVLELLVCIGTNAHVFVPKNCSDSVLYQPVFLFSKSNS